MVQQKAVFISCIFWGCCLLKKLEIPRKIGMLTTLPRSPNLVPYPHSTPIYPKPLKKSSPKVKQSRVDSEGEVHPFSPCCTKRNYSTRIGHERTAGHAQNVLYSGRRKDREREREKKDIVTIGSPDLGFQISRDETKSREKRPHNSTISGRACANHGHHEYSRRSSRILIFMTFMARTRRPAHSALGGGASQRSVCFQ